MFMALMERRKQKKWLSEGKMAATVAQSPKTFGKKAGEVFISCFRKKN